MAFRYLLEKESHMLHYFRICAVCHSSILLSSLYGVPQADGWAEPTTEMDHVPGVR